MHSKVDLEKVARENEGRIGMLRSREEFSNGLLNIPMDDRQARYPFFEIDTEDIKAFSTVYHSYIARSIPFAFHRTGSGGWHFLSIHRMTKDEHHAWIQELKGYGLNKNWPPQCLRITPNKYVHEKWQWIYSPDHVDAELELLVWSIEQQDIATLGKHYRLVRYPLP